jgi:hypothetical protein
MINSNSAAMMLLVQRLVVACILVHRERSNRTQEKCHRTKAVLVGISVAFQKPTVPQGAHHKQI